MKFTVGGVDRATKTQSLKTSSFLQCPLMAPINFYVSELFIDGISPIVDIVKLERDLMVQPTADCQKVPFYYVGESCGKATFGQKNSMPNYGQTPGGQIRMSRNNFIKPI